jgi:hypothetical protein
MAAAPRVTATAIRVANNALPARQRHYRQRAEAAFVACAQGEAVSDIRRDGDICCSVRNRARLRSTAPIRLVLALDTTRGAKTLCKDAASGSASRHD